MEKAVGQSCGALPQDKQVGPNSEDKSGGRVKNTKRRIKGEEDSGQTQGWWLLQARGDWMSSAGEDGGWRKRVVGR